MPYGTYSFVINVVFQEQNSNPTEEIKLFNGINYLLVYLKLSYHLLTLKGILLFDF
jgi:hypothetical protein